MVAMWGGKGSHHGSCGALQEPPQCVTVRLRYARWRRATRRRRVQQYRLPLPEAQQHDRKCTLGELAAEVPLPRDVARGGGKAIRVAAARGAQGGRAEEGGSRSGGLWCTRRAAVAGSRGA